MKRRVLIHLAYFLALGLAFAGAVALAGSVGTLTTFSPNTVAKSSEVNGNFSAVETAVNDNDSRITTNETNISTNTSDISANSSQISTNTSDIATNATNIAANTTAIAANTAAMPMAWGQSDVDLASSTRTNSPIGPINSFLIDVPSDGVLVISGSVYMENGTGTAQNYILLPKVDGAGVPFQSLTVPTPGDNDAAAQFQAAGTGPSAQFTLSYTVTVPVTVGSHSLSQEAGPVVGTATFDFNDNNLTVIFFPATHGTFLPGLADTGL